MIKDMYKIQKVGKEWQVSVYKPFLDKTALTKVYVLGRNDGKGPRNVKVFRGKDRNETSQALLPKKFANAMLAWVTMRGET